MIDPTNITNYNLSDAELEEHLLFWICAAGKNGKTAARSLEKLITDLQLWFSYKFSPFVLIDKTNNFRVGLATLPMMMQKSGIGCYNSKARTFTEVVKSNINLRTCSAEDLEKIYGIGMKTSRCFILHSRKDARYAGLDTHMLKHLREVGIENVPKSTPSSKKLYLTLEKEVLSLAHKAGMSPADYDLMIWNSYSK